MRVTLWGTRGSLATPGPETQRYGGNTSCVAVAGPDGALLVLDAGTGIRRLGASLPQTLRRVDILLSHLHMDHIIGLGFFRPLRTPGVEAHIWGPASTTLDLAHRLGRYLSPPLFPLRLRDLECDLHVHDVVPGAEFAIGAFRVSSALICHPDPAVGYRIAQGDVALAYLPDHEVALGVPDFPHSGEWTSGYGLAAGADLLIHDAQYTDEEYRGRVGWGHSTLAQAIAFARLCGVKRFVPFHHDPDRSDDALERWVAESASAAQVDFPVVPARERAVFELA